MTNQLTKEDIDLITKKDISPPIFEKQKPPTFKELSNEWLWEERKMIENWKSEDFDALEKYKESNNANMDSEP